MYRSVPGYRPHHAVCAERRCSRVGRAACERRDLGRLLLSLACLLPLWLCLSAGHARAQSCHAASLRPASNVGLRIALSSLLGNFHAADAHGEYQGLLATLVVSHPWFTADVTLPGFRIAQIGSHAYGLGDVLVDLRANLYRSADDTFVAGPEFAATLPTGRASDGLGMGHVMLMPGGFVQWHTSEVSLIVQVAYGRALANGDHAHHTGPLPIVNPMNRSELEHAIGGSLRLHPNLQATTRLLGAVSLFDHRGQAREVLAPGLQFIAGAFDAAIELQLPVVGTPFTSRTLVTLGAQW